MQLDAIAIGQNPPDDVNVIIEVSIGGEPIKYEMDKAAGTLVVDRFLHTPVITGRRKHPNPLAEWGRLISTALSNR
jgi:inorganic pyrophosphatase